MEPEGPLPGRRSVLLLAVRDGDRRVEVQPQLRIWGTQIRAGTRGPRPFACRRPCRPDRGQMVGIDPVQHPPRGRHRRHRTEQVLAVIEHADPADRVRAIGDRDGQIGEHPPRLVNRDTLVGADQRPVTASTRPVSSAISRSRPTPACDTTTLPSALTLTRRDPLLPFTVKVPVL